MANRLLLLFGLLSIGCLLWTGCASKPAPYVYEPPAPQPSRAEPAPRAQPPVAPPDDQPSRRWFARDQERVAVAEPMVSAAPISSAQRVSRAEDTFDVAASVARSYRLRARDPLVIQLIGIPEPAQLEFVIDDAGEISLPYLDPIRAEGLTLSELQRGIQRAYIDEGIYRRITVNVVIPTQSYFVRGEVRQPGRFPLTGGITVLQAIAAAGGYTEFANPRRINIIREGETLIENARQMEQNPEEDMPVKAGDVIIVPRSIF